MNLTSVADVRSRLCEIGVSPSRTLGQNFLVDRNIRDIILGAMAPGADDCLVEVGPGLGVLTEPLLDRVAHLTAVEKDAKLYGGLCSTWGGRSNLDLIHADVMDVGTDRLLSHNGAGCTGLISNLPYSVASPLLIDVAESDLRPARMVVTVQKEVADRICAAPGCKDYGLLSIRLQVDYRPRCIHTIGPSCFWPRPAIDSAVVRLDRIERAGLVAGVRAALYAVVGLAFTRRRKQMLGTISALRGVPAGAAGAILAEAGVPPAARPEELAVDTWLRLAHALDGCRAAG